MAEIKGPSFSIIRSVENNELREAVTEALPTIDPPGTRLTAAKGLLGLTIIQSHEVGWAIRYSPLVRIDRTWLAQELEEAFAGTCLEIPILDAKILSVVGYGGKPGKGAQLKLRKMGAEVYYPGAEDDRQELTEVLDELLQVSYNWLPFKPKVRLANGNLHGDPAKKAKYNSLKTSIPSRVSLSAAKVIKFK